MKGFILGSLCALSAGFCLGAHAAEGGGMDAHVPENVYRGEMVTFPGPWAHTLGRKGIILVTDEQLEHLADPDMQINISLSHEPRMQSLREICEQAQQQGVRTLIISFDHFFAQYRPGQHGKPRRLMPDMQEYIDLIAKISDFAQGYGLGLELSLLTPLEIGPGYVEETGEAGRWLHYSKGLRDPKSGRYSVQFWRQEGWANNKGPLTLKDAGVRVFAFREQAIPQTEYVVVNPEAIVEISDTAQVEVWEDSRADRGDYQAVRVRVHGAGREDIGPLDRVLVVQQYQTPEMDYFSDKALPYLQNLADRYVDAGIKFNALYSDEMHIQQDWGYFNHHDRGEFALRYVSPGFEQRFAERYGEQYADMAPYMLYFAYGQNTYTNDLTAKDRVMHVFGASPEAVRQTALFRARYYQMLQNDVVDLFVAAKRHLEQRTGHQLESRAHATWAESPTCDRWDVDVPNARPHMYEYTSNFKWSNTVHQAASACYDYWKWGEFLTGTGNDTAEGGWLDRNYTGLSQAASTGVINEVPNSYAAHWGMPREIHRRRSSLANASGAAPAPYYGMVQDMQHRDVNVLMLYPLDLVAAEERFGSWMNQYGYANYITQQKLLELSEVKDGVIEVAGRRRYDTLVALFEPFPRPELLEMMQRFVEDGGEVIWAGPPPVVGHDGSSVLGAWQGLFGVQYQPRANEGFMAPGKAVQFEGRLDGLAPMVILTDFLVDHIYPVSPGEGGEVLARVKDDAVAMRRGVNEGGATFLGFRPRDDQSASLGYETRYWFDILQRLGAYEATGTFEGHNDNPEHLSRNSRYLVTRFPNVAVGIAPHLRDLEEAWPGGFARNEEEDAAIIAELDLPSEEILLIDFLVDGHTVTFNGQQALSFRTNDSGELVAFCGAGSDRISVDGNTVIYADREMPLAAWAPVPEERRGEAGTLMQIWVQGNGELRIPAAGLPEDIELVAQGATPGSRGAAIPHRREEGRLVFDSSQHHGWYYLAPKQQQQAQDQTQAQQ